MQGNLEKSPKVGSIQPGDKIIEMKEHLTVNGIPGDLFLQGFGEPRAPKHKEMKMLVYVPGAGSKTFFLPCGYEAQTLLPEELDEVFE